MNEVGAALLNEIFAPICSEAPKAAKFRAKHYDHLQLLDRLNAEGLIELQDEKYYLGVIGLKALSNKNPAAASILSLCQHIFARLRIWYLSNAGEELGIDELAEITGVPAEGVQSGLRYLSQSPIFDGWSATRERDIVSMKPSEKMLRFQTFDDVVAELERLRQASSKPEADNVAESLTLQNKIANDSKYVDPHRIDALRDIRSNRWDFARLIQICEELNDCFEHQNYFAVGGLLRTLLDHVPPVFGYDSFRSMVNQYGGRSIRYSLLNLENSSRKISDSLLHQKIRRKESLPSRTMIDFSNDLDVLLAELIRIVQEQNEGDEG